jgi:ATP-dependent DNA helicase RecG
MVVKHWILEVLRGLAESLASVPHEINEIDWKTRLSHNSKRLGEHLMAFANHPGDNTLVYGVGNDGAAQGIAVEEVVNVVGTLTKSAALSKINEINKINELN